MVPGPPLSSVATRLTRVSGSPATSPPKRSASSRRLKVRGLPLMSARWALRAGPGCLFFRGQGLEDPVGDIEAGTAIHRLLQDEIVLLRFGDLLDDAVRAFEERLQLLVAPQVQVLAVGA